MYSAGCLDKLEALIIHRNPTIRTEAICAITRLIITEPNLLSEILERPLFATLLKTILSDMDSVNSSILIIYLRHRLEKMQLFVFQRR